MGHVRRRGASQWQGRYRDAGGREHLKTFRRRQDAQAWVAAAEVARRTGEWVDPRLGRVTFGSWAEQYLATTPKRATTAARDRVVVRRWLEPELGAMPLSSITPATVRALVDRMAEQLAPATVRTNYGVLRAILAAAVETDLIARSPCRGVHLPAEQRQAPRFLSVEELERLADTLPLDYRAMAYVGGVLGLRWSEVAGLRVGRIDFLRRTLTVAETVAEVEGRLIVAEVKTRASRRTIGVPPEVMEELAAHLARRGRPGPDELVFVAPGGGPLRAGNFRRRAWEPAVRTAGLDGLTFHGLRHTAVGLMIEAGAHVESIKVRMGHSSIRVTSDVYGHVLPAVDDTVTSGLGELLRSSRGQAAVKASEGRTGEEGVHRP